MAKTYLQESEREYARILREINGIMKEKRMRIADLAQEINRDRTTLGRKLNGSVPLTVPELLRIKEVLSGEIHM